MSRVTYHHIEIRRHTVLLANGLPAESYLDTGDRGNFSNAGVTRLFADFGVTAGIRHANVCAPFVAHGGELDAVRGLIAARGRRKRPSRSPPARRRTG